MKKRKKSPFPMAVAGQTEYPSSPLKKQSPYGTTPWKPNEAPTIERGQFIIEPLDAKPERRDEFFAVECPVNRGKKIIDEETGGNVQGGSPKVSL